MTLWQAIRQIYSPVPLQGLSVLPSPTPKPAPVKAPKKESSLYVIDETRSEFGFRMDKESDRAGAVRHLTGHDRQLLEQRGYWGGKGVQAQNATAKRMWHDGASEEETAQALGLGVSWVQKRFGTFATALSIEKGEGAE